MRRRYASAAILALPALAAVAAFSVYSLRSGGELLPNGLLGKSPLLGALAGRPLPIAFHEVATTVWRTPHLVLGCIVAGLCSTRRIRAPLRVWLRLTVGTSALHLLAARTGWFYRYEAYLMALLILGCGAALVELRWLAGTPSRPGSSHGRLRARTIVLPVACVLATAFAVKRLVGAHVRAPLACKNTFEQSVQVGRLLARLEPDAAVLVHDAGAASWYSRRRLIDLGGLGTQSLSSELRAFRQARRAVPRDTMIAIARRYAVDLAVLGFDPRSWEVPAEWTPVSRWAIGHNVACAFDTLTFYATTDASVKPLALRLDEAARRLPPGVNVR
jgi:hypothetical protein